MTGFMELWMKSEVHSNPIFELAESSSQRRLLLAFVIVHIICREVFMNNNVLGSFASQFAYGIIYVMTSLGTEDGINLN